MNMEETVRSIVREEIKKIVIENNQKIHEEPKQIKRKRASFDLDVELLKELKKYAILHDRNLYEIVETALRQYLFLTKASDYDYSF